MPRVQGVALTGSEGAGAVVASQAGKALKKSTLELGGADAFVVLADADLAKTSKWAVFGRHWNAGQVCVSSKRMIVVDAVYDDFLALYRKGVAELVAGDPFDAKTTLAPLSSQSAANEVKQKILRSREAWRQGRRSRAARACRWGIRAADDPDRCRRRQPRSLLGVLWPGVHAVPRQG
jgi:acyl-CoA reductase-like NAD-dependent aldehyde dehydrogenase